MQKGRLWREPPFCSLTKPSGVSGCLVAGHKLVQFAFGFILGHAIAFLNEAGKLLTFACRLIELIVLCLKSLS